MHGTYMHAWYLFRFLRVYACMVRICMHGTCLDFLGYMHAWYLFRFLRVYACMVFV